MKLTPNMNVVCMCRGGQVRSVAARYILADQYGFRKVLTCGWEKNDQPTIDMLYRWADAILIVGSTSKWIADKSVEVVFEETFLIDIGPDVYGWYGHPELLGVLRPKIHALVIGELNYP